MQQIFLKVYYVPGAVVGTWDTQILLEKNRKYKMKYYKYMKI